MKYLYLDKSALIDLAKFRTEKYWFDIDNLLRDGNHTLFLSTTHMYEFSKGRKENDYTATYLDELPCIKWIIPPWYMWTEEVKGGLNYCLKGMRSSFRFHYDLFFEMYIIVNRKYKNLKYYIGQPITPGKVIDFFKKEKIYKETEEVAKHCTKMVRKIREESLIWKSWKIALRMQIRDFWPIETEAKLKIKQDDSFLDRMIKVSDFCMPSLVFLTKLRREKYSTKEHVEPNDFIDEFHASYAPYCDVLMHDKRACRRIRQTDSEYVKKFAAEPEELLRILSG